MRRMGELEARIKYGHWDRVNALELGCYYATEQATLDQSPKVYRVMVTKYGEERRQQNVACRTSNN